MSAPIPSFLRTPISLELLPCVGVGLAVGSFVAAYFGLGVVPAIPVATVAILGAMLTPYLAARWTGFKEALWVKLVLIGLVFGAATAGTVHEFATVQTLPPAVVALLFSVGISGVFGWPLTLLADREGKAFEGADRARGFVGAAIVVVSLINLLQVWGNEFDTSGILATVVGFAAFAVGAFLVREGARRRSARRQFLSDAELGKVAEYIVVRDEWRTTLVRVPSADANYRVAPTREEILELSGDDVSPVRRLK